MSIIQVNGTLVQYHNRGNNMVISGRHKDGYPNYLVGPEFIDMTTHWDIYKSRMGTVSASSEYNTSYRATGPLKNQIAKTNERWITTNNVPNGWWQYEFTDPDISPPIIVGLWMSGATNNDPARSFKKWQFLGWNEITNTWEIIYKEDNDQPFRGWNSSAKEDGRMYWFTDNTKSYKKIRINIDENHGGTYTGIISLRLYSTPVPDMHKYDTVLYATPEEPFTCSISAGLHDDGSQIASKLLKLSEHVTYDGRLLAECTKNYMYIVPQNSDGVFPPNLDKSRAVEIQQNNTDQRFYLYSDHRKIHYGTLRDVERECTGMLQCRDTAEAKYTPTAYMTHDMSPYRFQVSQGNIAIEPTVSHRGSIGSYDLTSTSQAWISPNIALGNNTATYPEMHGHPYNNICTVEIDFKWTGPTPEEADNYYVIFDAGYYTNLGWMVAYHNRKKCISIHSGSANINGWSHSIPFDATDDSWHTLSVSINMDKLYIHVDGKCLGAFENRQIGRMNYQYWMLGRWVHTGSNSFIGYLNNFRYTLGTCLYCSRDYVVPNKFYTTYIPDKTLWFNDNKQCVREYQAATQSWIDTPMLPIGCIETGRREHLLTDQPKGTHHNQATKYVDNSSWLGTQYDGNWSIRGLMNFGNVSSYMYHTPNNATTTENYVQFKLVEPMAFDRFYTISFNDEWRRFLFYFYLQGSNDGETWTDLYVQTTNDDTSIFRNSQLDGTTVSGYKSYDIVDTTPYMYYKMLLPPKAELSAYVDGYSKFKMLFFFKDSKPEVLSRNSVMVGDMWSYGPIAALGGNKLYRISLPTDNIPYTAEVECIDWVNSHSTRRKSELSGWWYNTDAATTAGAHSINGEVVYLKDNELWINTGNYQLTLYNGTWASGVDQHNTTTNIANYYITIKRGK